MTAVIQTVGEAVASAVGEQLRPTIALRSCLRGNQGVGYLDPWMTNYAVKVGSREVKVL